MTKEQTLKKLVRIEAANLKVEATPQELAKLNFSKLNSGDTGRCIYGQMTGFCYSDRANELIVKCAPRVYNGGFGLGSINNLNGAPAELNGEYRGIKYHSPIEVFIHLNSYDYNSGKANNKILIDYLQGRNKILTFIKRSPFGIGS